MHLSELMTTQVKTVAPGQPVAEARELMRLGGFHHLVVMESGQLVGVVSERDLKGAPRRAAQVGDVMVEEVVTASPGTTVRQAANLLRGRSIGCLPVLDGKRLVGLVTITDLLELLGR